MRELFLWIALILALTWGAMLLLAKEPGTRAPVTPTDPGGAAVDTVDTMQPQEPDRITVELGMPEVDPFLAEVIAEVGPLPPVKGDLDSKALAYWWAMKNKAPQAATREQAMVENVPARLLPEIMDCIHAMIRAGELPLDYLTEPLEEIALARRPVGQERIDFAVKFAGGSSRGIAEHRIRERLMSRYGSRPRLARDAVEYYSKSRLWNRDSKPIDDEAAQRIVEQESLYHDKFQDVLEEAIFLDEFFLEREEKLVAEDYVAVPFNAVDVFTRCGATSLERDFPYSRSVTFSEGWTVLVRMERHEVPRFDQLLHELERVAAERERAIKEIIEAL